MAKNFASIYAQGDSIGLEQKIFCKAETTKGTMVAPAGTDFIYTLSGTGGSLMQPLESSPSRSGRHHTSVIQGKEETTFSIVSLFNVDTSVDPWAVTMIDPALRVLMKNLLGAETVGANLQYDTSTPPADSFTMLENGDVQGKQFVGAFLDTAELSFPGDGNAQWTMGGFAKTMYRMGVAKFTTDQNFATTAASTITLDTPAEAKRFEVGGMFMIITNAAGGATRSADTPSGTPLKISAINETTGVLTITDMAGAAVELLDADADGTTGFYVCYYEPTSPTAINNPLTGLTGSVTFGSGLTKDCIRSVGLSINNAHEAQNYCFGKSGLSDVLYTAGGRMTATLTVEMNLDHELVGYLNDLKDIVDETITLNLGDSTGRYFQLVAKVKFPIPEIPIPDTGSVVVTFESPCYQSAIDQSDELVLYFK